MIVLSFFDYTTNMVKPWAESGHKCYCVDLQHSPGETIDGNIVKVGADAMNWLPPKGEISFCSFFPPCTDISASGARWFRDKGLGKLIQALTLFKRAVDLAELIGAPYMIENPVSTVSKYWREPDYKFHPYEYGDPYTKKTCLWTGNGFVMPQRKPVNATEGSKMHLIPPSKDRANLRSATPEGFARAVYEANK